MLVPYRLRLQKFLGTFRIPPFTMTRSFAVLPDVYHHSHFWVLGRIPSGTCNLTHKSSVNEVVLQRVQDWGRGGGRLSAY